MIARSDQVIDEYDRAVPGAKVYVYNQDGTLATLTSDGTAPLSQPVTTDAFGTFSYWAAAGVYREDTWFGGKLRFRGVTAVGLGSSSAITVTAAAGNDVSSRALLASIAAPAALQKATLTEAGREGTFVFDSSNLSAKVTADPNQGIYIAPASDTTGASGAWVRKFSGPLNVKWFGAVADDTTNDGAAFLAAIALAKALAVGGSYGYGKGSPTLYIPSGVYFLGTSTLDIYSAMRLLGEGSGTDGGTPTVLRWSTGTTGIRVQSNNTSGASGTRTADGFNGSGTIIEGLYLQGAFVNPSVSTESESHGIHLRGKATIRECYINLFEGDGIYAYVTAGSGGATEGNANNSYIARVTVAGNRNGVFFQGADVNAGAFVMVSAYLNRRWGIFENSFLGNGHLGHHAAGNGTYNVGSNVPYIMASYGGHYYNLVDGGNPANAPSGTTADNADWYYNALSGGSAYAPAWTNTISARSGGAFFTSTSKLNGCYSEESDLSQCITAGCIEGSQIYGKVKGPGLYESLSKSTGAANAPSKNLNAGMRVTGNNPNMGGPAGVELYMFAGNAKIGAYDRDNATWVPIIFEGNTQSFTVGGSTVAQMVSAGLNIPSGKVLQVNGTQVVGARQTGTPADATDLATALTLVNALKAKLVAHGLIS